MKHLVITGGHHNSALVIAKACKKRGYKVSWIGHRQAAAGDSSPSAEYQEVSAAKIPFHELRAGKLSKSTQLKEILRIPLGIIRGVLLLRRLRPTAILSFGGYIGFAVATAGWLLGVPLYVHEQTVIAGKSNQLISRLARRIFLTWESSWPYFPQDKSVVVGLPLRDSILKPSHINYFENKLPTIAVLGGKQGSHALNLCIAEHLDKLLTEFNIIHQTGTNTVTSDYAHAVARRKSLDSKLAKRYIVRGYIGEDEIGTVLGSVDLYVGRSGAHITYELGILGVPSVLIPYMYTHRAEQWQNAEVLAGAGSGVILAESELTYRSLTNAIHQLQSKETSPLNLPRNAKQQIVTALDKDLKR